MKSLRLAFFNIKKHIWEVLVLILLTTASVTMLGISLTNFGKVERIYDHVLEGNGCIRAVIGIKSEGYLDEYEEILRNDERVERVIRFDALHTLTGRMTAAGKNDIELTYYIVDEDNEALIENAELDTTLSEKELAALEHPIRLPYFFKDSLGFRAGEEATLILGGKELPVTVAGFYDSGMFATTYTGLKLVVSSQDYKVLRVGTDEVTFLGFDEKDQKDPKVVENIFSDFQISATEVSDGTFIRNAVFNDYYAYERLICSVTCETVLTMVVVMSVILTVAIAFLIWQRISSDMEEQIRNIGVLMALGYRAKDISRVYVWEYALIGIIGGVIGFLCTLVISPVFFMIFRIMSGHHGTVPTAYGSLFAGIVLMILILSGIAWIKAAKVRKYPPVVALRNGTADHLFKKNHFSLEKTKNSVNLRLAMKLFAGKVGQSIGIFVCITAASTALMTGVLAKNLVGNDLIVRSAGMELSDLRMELNPYADAKEMRNDLLKDDRVRKVLLTVPLLTPVEMGEDQSQGLAQVYENFEDTENIFCTKGRPAIHDNEFMVNNLMAVTKGIDVGDEVVLGSDRYQQKFIVTGIVTSVTNSGLNIYLTYDGYHRLEPTSSLNCLEVYLNDGVDSKEFRKDMETKYGRSLRDLRKAVEEASTPEEKIRARAEEKMAVLISEYGVSGVDYSITVGDTVISGNSDDYRIKDTSSLKELIDQQNTSMMIAVNLGVIMFGFLDLVITAVILIMVTSSAIRKLQTEMGVMKALGYTSRELTLQIGYSVMPPVILAIITGGFAGAFLIKMYANLFGNISFNYTHLILTGLAMMVFCMLISIVGILRIRKITPYRLMAE